MSSSQRKKREHHRLDLEALEGRQLFDAGGLLPPLAPLTKFASAADFDQYFLNQAIAQYGVLFGAPYFPPPIVFGLQATTADESKGPAASSLPISQDPRVGEGDIIQSDGAHLYVASQNQIVIMDTPPGGGLDVVRRTNVPGYVDALILDGSRLAVISQVSSGPIFFQPIQTGTLPGGIAILPGISLVEVRIYDVSNAAAPELDQDTLYGGTFETASTVGGHLYVVTNDFNGRLPLPQPVSNGDGTQSYETAAAYAARVEPELQDLILPHYYAPDSSTASQTPGAFVSAPTEVYQGRFPQDSVVSSILTFDMTANTSPVTDAQTFITSYEPAVYATAEHLYFVNGHNSTGATDPAGSVIQRFDMVGDQVQPGPAGFVPVQVFNKFAVDENGNYLRVVGTTPPSSAPPIGTTPPSSAPPTSALYVLQQDGTSLNVVGALEDIGSGDNSLSVRFNGSKAYVATYSYGVTARSELAVIDLTDPTAPTLAGQVQTAAYEEDLQVLDNGHLLAVGVNTGVVLTLFDVSDAQSPAIVDQIQISPGNDVLYTSSQATLDANALTYSSGQSLLGITIDGAARNIDGSFASQNFLYQVDIQSGFHLVGAVTHDSEVERSLIQGDFFYSIAANSVKVQPINQGPLLNNAQSLSLGSSLEVRITDIPRQITAPPLQPIIINQPFSGTLLSFTVTDPTGISVSIAWGDGTTSEGTVTSTGNNRYSVSGQHIYEVAGGYQTSLVLSRNGQDLGFGFYTNFIQVGDIDPQTGNFLQKLYNQLLGRQAEQLGLEYWATQMRQGISRASVAQALLGSLEYRIAQINSVYGMLLGRQAENAAFAPWLDYLSAGHSFDDIRIAVLSSDEFFARAGSASNFVSGAFADLLGRQAEPAEQMAWQTYLQLSLPRATVVTLIAHSQEAAVHEVRLDFQKLLQRPVELGGLRYFSDALLASGTSASVEAAILGSAEFWQSNVGD